MGRSETREKILDTSLALFNKHGTSEISTNHIASEAGISPGNLYYYFKNKEEIVRALFERMIKIADRVWLSEGSGPEYEIYRYTQLMDLFMHFFAEYRFFFQDFIYIMRRDKKLTQLHRKMVEDRIKVAGHMYSRLCDAGLVVPLPEEELEAANHRGWIISSFWFVYLEFMGRKIDENAMKEGTWQMISLMYPYMTPEGRRIAEPIFQKYRISKNAKKQAVSTTSSKRAA